MQSEGHEKEGGTSHHDEWIIWDVRNYISKEVELNEDQRAVENAWRSNVL